MPPKRLLQLVRGAPRSPIHFLLPSPPMYPPVAPVASFSPVLNSAHLDPAHLDPAKLDPAHLDPALAPPDPYQIHPLYKDIAPV